MPKFISDDGRADPHGTHLYPASSVEDMDQDADTLAGALTRVRGRAAGVAYCGADGDGERVFAPHDLADTLDGFTEPGHRWVNPCPVCARIIELKRFADPEWRDEFDAAHPTD